jgi:predicted TIM-barrel fold metal-dependent hydrolase
MILLPRLGQIACVVFSCLSAPLTAQESSSDAPLDGRDGRDLLLRLYRPHPTLRVTNTDVQRARFPVVDVHTHFRYRFRHSDEMLDDFVKLMDRHQIALCVSMDGKLGDDFRGHAKYLWDKYPQRFAIFANVDWIGEGDDEDPSTWACQQPGFGRRTAIQLEEAVQLGASGLKLFKQFGLGHRNADGSLIEIDDPRWDPIWTKCGELGLPVLIHTADPVAFFDKIDETNERWEELFRHPEWRFPAEKFPSREQLLSARNRVIGRHPKTIFVGAHLANYPEDLAVVAQWLDDYPNLYVEFASRIGELGRQPYTARRFLVDHADRVLFGTDGPWPEKRIKLYWRFLETYDEHFPYSEKEFPPQGFWRIYGVGLPDDVLRKIYYENAARILPGIKSKLADFRAKTN